MYRETWESVLLGGLGKLGSRLRFGSTRLLVAKEQDASAAMLCEVLHKVGARLRIGGGCGEERERNQRQIARLHTVKGWQSHAHHAHPGDGARHRLVAHLCQRHGIGEQRLHKLSQ